MAARVPVDSTLPDSNARHSNGWRWPSRSVYPWMLAMSVGAAKAGEVHATMKKSQRLTTAEIMRNPIAATPECVARECVGGVPRLQLQGGVGCIVRER